MSIFSRKTRRGFTLIEISIAMLIGTATVVVAAKIAQLVMSQSAKGKQRGDLAARAMLAGRQLRADIRLAGIGSSGAIAVDPTIPPFTSLAFQTTGGGYSAMPVIAGANNIPARGVGGATLKGGSDAVQLVTMNSNARVLVDDRGLEGTATLPVETTVPLDGCRMIYIADHSGPSGTGRVHLARIDSMTADSIDVAGTLQFTVAIGSEVMCARISTYWLDDQGWLHRSDLMTGPLTRLHPSYPVYVDTGAGNDLHSPGVEDMQLAYRVSAEAFRFAARAVPSAVEERWAFAGVSSANDLLNGDINRPAWFEVRQVRLNLLERTLRKIGGSTLDKSAGTREDGAEVRVLREHAVEWMTTAETLSNLRFFDLGSPEGAAAEPF
jgi:prepilin-type N-terminal cleavage/methylation domain-containing protein